MPFQVQNNQPTPSNPPRELGTPAEAADTARAKRLPKKWWTNTKTALLYLPCFGFASSGTGGGQKPVSGADSGTALVAPRLARTGRTMAAGGGTPLPLDVLLDDYFFKAGWRVDVSAEMQTHFANLQDNTVTTPEASVRVATPLAPELNNEIKRSLVRLRCFNLLSLPPESFSANLAAAHASFTESQPMHRTLTRATYDRLAARFTGQSDDAKSVIAASASITMSRAMLFAAKAYVPNTVFSEDAETFLSNVAPLCPSIVPQWTPLSEGARRLFPAAYIPQAHLRHMLYTEGGDNMFASLRERIAEGQLSDAQYGIWVGRWLINIAGFRGHEESSGSIYLDEPTGQAVLTLLEELDALRKDSARDVLSTYLDYRAGLVGLGNSRYAGHLASMLRLYSEADAADFKKWFNGLSADYRDKCEADYANYLSVVQVTPTFEPALLQSLRLCASDHSEIGTIYKIYQSVAQSAYAQYRDGVQAGRISCETPLIFRDLARKEQAGALYDAYVASGAVPPVSVQNDGLVVVQAPPAL